MLLDPSYNHWGLDSVKSIAQAFIDKGADLTVQDMQGNGVLHYALKWNDVDVVEMLLKAGATAVINIPNNDQETALEVAGFSALEDLLLQYGADPRMKVSHARRSLLESVKKDPDTFEKFTKAVKELEKKGIPDPMAQ